MSEEKVTTKRRRRVVKKESPKETLPTASETAVVADSSNEDESIKPIVPTGGPRLGVKLYIPDDDIQFSMMNALSRSPLGTSLPMAIRVKKEGGVNHKVEFFYSTNDSPIALDKFDHCVLTIKTGYNEETNKAVGRRFKGLVCIGKFYEFLPSFGDEKLVKYICLTNYESHFDEIPRHLNGLGDYNT